ncbi:MAG: altronate dehydratase family protein [Negativicutes bacterium]|jgi:altronate hydrolase
MNEQLIIDGRDNVAVLLTEKNRIARGQKIAIRAIALGEQIVKYGYPIGVATAMIPAGAHVHTHNMRTALGAVREKGSEFSVWSFKNSGLRTEDCNHSFSGYRRANGKVGVRNELWIIPTVGCINRTVETIARRLNENYPRSENFDGVFALTHPFGCSQMGEDHENTKEILARLAEHPNAGAVIILGLGCENNTIDGMRAEIKRSANIDYISAQQTGDEVAVTVAAAGKLIEKIMNDRREKCNLSDLVVGLKCGGSDGLSGITANPLVGKLSDIIVAAGGTAVLTEVPEMFGAEELLFKQCADETVLQKAVAMVDDFKAYYRKHELPIYENPSPGNKAGGITTLEEKSLGCVQKGGSGTITGVLKYGESIAVKGLNLLSGPGNDLIAATALSAAGCQLVLFTTGRGTPFGAIAPTIKISTNSELAHNKPHWIDYNAGVLIEGTSFETETSELLEAVLAVAGGKQCKAELNGYKDIAIFKTGVVL